MRLKRSGRWFHLFQIHMNNDSVDWIQRLERISFWGGIAAIGALVALIIISLFTVGMGAGSEVGMFDRSWCFESTCVERATKAYGLTISLLVALFQVAAGYAAVLGIIVSAKTYVVGHAGSKLHAHMSNLNSFRDYVEKQLQSHDRITSSSLDVYLWYALMFPNSANGDVGVGVDYKSKLTGIAKEIARSNLAFANNKTSGFSHKMHQDVMIPILSSIGFRVRVIPRLEYFSAEDEILKLISRVNEVFDPTAAKFPERSYRHLG